MRFTISYPNRLEARRKELGISLEDIAAFTRINYMVLKDFETGKRNQIGANDLEVLCDALDIDGSEVCYDYSMRPPELKLKMVYVQAEKLIDFLRKTGMNGSQFATRAGVSPQIIYSFMARRKRACKAHTAVKIAKAIGIPAEEFCPAFALYSPAEMNIVTTEE